MTDRTLPISDRKVPGFLNGGGDMGRRMREFDWASHPLGEPTAWPPALQMAVSLCLNSNFPTAVYWGPQLYVLYNDAWAHIPGERHPAALGRKGAELWTDIWREVGPEFEQVLAEGASFARFETMLPMVRSGVRHETWWNYSLTPIRNADNSIGGAFNQGNEVTDSVLGRRARQLELQRWRELFRQAPAPIALLRGPTHVFEVVNDAYTQLVGRGDVLGKSVHEALPEVVSQGFIALLDGVFRTGEPYLGHGVTVQLRRDKQADPEERVLDFIYHPTRSPAGDVDGIFVLAMDVTERTRAEAALRISNWQLGEERERLKVLFEAEQRAQSALKLFTDNLEAEVARRTSQLERALEQQGAITDRLRATFETSLMFQGYISPAGVVLDANRASLQAIGATLEEVVGRKFWDTPWFTATEGVPELVREAVYGAMGGRPVFQALEINLPGGRRRFDFWLRPVTNARGELVGIVPEAVDVTERLVPA